MQRQEIEREPSTCEDLLKGGCASVHNGTSAGQSSTFIIAKKSLKEE